MRLKTPPLYATGHWVIDDPFGVPGSAIYTCKAIRSIDSLKIAGINPYNEFYALKGITVSRYEQDVRNLVNIVTLMSAAFPVIHVPDTYIRSYPETTTIPYRHVVLSISLGAVADTLAIEDLKTKIAEYTLASLGIVSVVKEHQANSMAESVDQVIHQSLENNRLARIADNQTEYARIQSLTLELTRLREQYRILEQLAIANNLLPPI
jgi:hypothetical protein